MKGMVLTPSCNAPVEALGGKGHGLARLAAAGLPVPASVVVTTDAFHAFFTAELRALAHAATVDPARRADLTARVRARPLAVDIGRALQDLGHPAWLAVRSSAVHEDGACRSGAGVLRSYLGVTPSISRVTAAIKSVWLSALDAPARAYAGGLEPDILDAGVAVVLQPMLSASASGVAFAQPDGTRVEAVYGLPFPLVNGSVTPDAYLTRADGTCETYVEPYKRVGLFVHDPAWTGARPGTAAAVRRSRDRVLPGVLVKRHGYLTAVRMDYPQYETPVLSDEDVQDVSELAWAAAMTGQGDTADVEWAETPAGWTILQARPVTAHAPLGPSSLGDMQGVAAGAVTGRAVDPARAPVTPGTLLLVTEFGPQHLPLLALAGGVITERGGMLSHGAILCRELGKPMVVTRAPHAHLHGQTLRLNGTDGTVELLAPVMT